MLKILDSGFYRNDNMHDEAAFFKGHITSLETQGHGRPTYQIGALTVDKGRILLHAPVLHVIFRIIAHREIVRDLGSDRQI